jgi:hypothetical protein
VVLLTLRTRSSHVPRETTACSESLIQFVTDLFLSTIRDHHSLQARVGGILALASKSKHGPSTLPSLEPSSRDEYMALQLEEILAAPLVIPDASTSSVASSDDGDDVYGQTQ